MSEPSAFEPLGRTNLSRMASAPSVRSLDQPWVMPVGVCLALALGALVFWQLSAGRARGEAVAAQRAAAHQTPAPRAAPTAPPAPAAPAPVVQQPAPVLPSPPDDSSARAHAPALVVDLSDAESNPLGAAANAQAIANAVGGGDLSGDERFASRFGSSGAARAQPLAHPATTVAQGAIIAGVLETAINSDLPGYVRALVTRDVRGFDGTRVLAPRGSRLIGQYRSSASLGASRAFIIWTRLIRPDGVSVDLNSPAADALGRGGLEGETDTHFLQRFGGAIVLSLIGAAADAAASNNSNNTQVVIGVSGAGQSAAAEAIHQDANIAPTIRVAQGTPIRIFVARDLDFSGTDDAGAQP